MSSADRLELPLIAATTPSLAESMRACFLRAGLSKTPGVWTYVLSNPRAWLGTAYHGVLERLPELGGEEGPARLQELWQQEIGRLEQQASSPLKNPVLGGRRAGEFSGYGEAPHNM